MTKNEFVKKFEDKMKGKEIEVTRFGKLGDGYSMGFIVNNSNQDSIIGSIEKIEKEFNEILDSFIEIPAMNKGLNFPRKFYYKDRLCKCEGSNTYAYVITLDTKEKLYEVNDTENTAFARIYGVIEKEEANYSEGKTIMIYPVD